VLLLNSKILKRGCGSILLDIFTKPMVFGRKEGQDVLDKTEEIAAFGGQDGKAVSEDGDFTAVGAVLVSV
jgi:hypothetical protein